MFKVTQEGDGGFVAECCSHNIVTQGDSAEELRANVSEAVAAYFFDQPKPSAFSLEALADAGFSFEPMAKPNVPPCRF